MSAGNQQERPIRLGWMVGFVVGGGCPSAGLARRLSRADRNDYETSFEAIRSGVDRNPQRPYARGPGHWIMRWSHLHGDMQGRHVQGRVVRSRYIQVVRFRVLRVR
jgi:hypothetical protein